MANKDFLERMTSMLLEDFQDKAVYKMHTCGKAYKEMMSSLSFLEDNLFNNSCYFKFATELYCLNNGYIQGKINKLEKILL